MPKAPFKVPTSAGGIRQAGVVPPDPASVERVIEG